MEEKIEMVELMPCKFVDGVSWVDSNMLERRMIMTRKEFQARYQTEPKPISTETK